MCKWKCIKSFSVIKFTMKTKFNENETMIKEQVGLGSIWNKDGFASFSEFRLENDSNWIEISEETFENCFEKLERSF